MIIRNGVSKEPSQFTLLYHSQEPCHRPCLLVVSCTTKYNVNSSSSKGILVGSYTIVSQHNFLEGLRRKIVMTVGPFSSPIYVRI